MGNNNYKIYSEIGLSAAKEAGDMLLDRFESAKDIRFKGRIDLVTEMDIMSEEIIVNTIKSNFPGHGIVAEEGSSIESESEYLWIIDPLDGTTNYAHGFGFFAVSVALQKNDDGIIAGVVYAPYLDETYTALKGGGSFLNGRHLQVSGTSELEKALIATGFPYDVKETELNIRFFSEFVLKAQAVRRPGSAALDLCCVAAGKFDGYWELKLSPWDMAAGSLIVQEAGGKVTGCSGSEFSLHKGDILATNKKIHKDMEEVLKNV